MERITCLSTSKVVKGYADSKIAKAERNDCVVRAVAASFNIDYNRAHKFVKEKFNRVDKKGTLFTYNKMLRLSENDKVFNKKIQSIKDLHVIRGTKKSKMTILSFLREYKKGAYFILVRGHALAVKNGVLIGNSNEGEHLKRIVIGAFKIGVR